MNTVDICNLSLSILGSPKIHNLDDDTNAARLCKVLYPFVRDKLFRDHIWTFATDFATLAELDETSPDSNYTYIYQLPYDCLRVIALDSATEDFRIVGKKLLANYTPVILTYSKRVEDATQFDMLFVEALQYALAAELALAMTQNAKLAEYAREQYERRLQNARTVNAQENTRAYQNEPVQSDFLSARLGSSSSADNPLTMV